MDTPVLQLTQEEYDLCVQLTQEDFRPSTVSNFTDLMHNITTKVMELPVEETILAKCTSWDERHKQMMDYILKHAQIIN